MRHLTRVLAVMSTVLSAVLPATAGEHPFLFLRRADIAGLRKKVQTPEFQPAYQRLLERSDRWLTVPPIEPPAVASNKETRAGGELGRARQAQGRVLTLALAYVLTEKPAYLERAKREMWSFTDVWKSWVDPYHGPPRSYDLMAGELAFTFGLAYDWLYDALTEDDRAKIRKALVDEALQPYLEITDPQRKPRPAGWWSGVNNWNPVCSGGALVAALALGEEYPRSAEVLARARLGMRSFFDHLQPEGGWDEGTGYWRYGMRYAVMAYAALESAGLGDDGVFARPGMRNTGSFAMFFSPGQVFSPSFGDSPGIAYDPILYFLGTRYRDDNLVWYAGLREPPRKTAEGWPEEVFELLWRPAGRPPTPLLPTSKLFPDIGWAVFVDEWPKPKVIASFKCGNLGVSHTHLDNNAIQLWAHGDFLLMDYGSGIYNARYFGPERWGFHEITTAGHNAVLIGGKEQAPRTRGQIGALQEHESWTSISGEAAANYADPTVQSARRTVLFVERRILIVIDEVALGEPKPVQVLWQSYPQPKLEGSGATIAGSRGAVDLAWVSTAALSAIAEDDPGKATRSPNLRPAWRLAVSAEAARKHAIVTVAAPREAARQAERPVVTLADRGWDIKTGGRLFRLRSVEGEWRIE